MSLKCNHCNQTLASKSSLNRHIKEVHKIEERPLHMSDFDTYNNKCLTCFKSFKSVKDLREHLVQQHNFISEEEELCFENIREFEKWLEEICKKEKVQYILSRGRFSLKKEGRRVCLYYCNRSIRAGVHVRKEERKRITKRQGSRKLNYACTSQIKLTEVDGKCYVTYYKTHYMHDRNIKHLSILKSEKEEIAYKILAGTPTSKILREVREKAVDEKDIQRISLLTRTDINNIKQAYGLNKKNTDCEEFSENTDDETLEAKDDLKMKIISEIQTISSKVEGEEVQESVLQDVYELLQAASSLLKRGGDSGNDEETQRIETYFLTVDVDDK